MGCNKSKMQNFKDFAQSTDRKTPVPKNKTILSKKDKERKNDTKKGRKNWTNYE